MFVAEPRMDISFNDHVGQFVLNKYISNTHLTPKLLAPTMYYKFWILYFLNVWSEKTHSKKL